MRRLVEPFPLLKFMTSPSKEESPARNHYRGRGVTRPRFSISTDQERPFQELQENQVSLLGLGALNAEKLFVTTFVLTGAMVCI